MGEIAGGGGYVPNGVFAGKLRVQDTVGWWITSNANTRKTLRKGRHAIICRRNKKEGAQNTEERKMQPTAVDYRDR